MLVKCVSSCFDHVDINCWMRCGSSPNQSGFWAVLSKIDEVLNGSYSPRDAASAVFALQRSLLLLVHGLERLHGFKRPIENLHAVNSRNYNRCRQVGCVAKTNGSLVEVVKIPTVARPTHLVHEPQAPLHCVHPIRHHLTVRPVVSALSLDLPQFGRNDAGEGSRR